MKNIRYTFLALLICNMSFSQEKIADSIKKPSIFKMHPNPAKDELFVLGTHKIKNIEILNILGKRKANFNFNKSIIKLNISDLTTGVYLIKVIDINDALEIKKLIIK